jgi:hypothetical protein
MLPTSRRHIMETAYQQITLAGNRHLVQFVKSSRCSQNADVSVISLISGKGLGFVDVQNNRLPRGRRFCFFDVLRLYLSKEQFQHSHPRLPHALACCCYLCCYWCWSWSWWWHCGGAQRHRAVQRCPWDADLHFIGSIDVY